MTSGNSPLPKEAYYRRPAAPKIEGEARRKALAEYLDHYAEVALENRALLNQKLPRQTFEEPLQRIGRVLLDEARRLSREDPSVTAFLANNPVPQCLGSALNDEIRTFALLLQALSQWVTAEKLAMDRFVFSGNVRREIKSLAKICPVCPEAFSAAEIELHHPVRDGRPPIPLSKKGHELIEGVVRPDDKDVDAQRLIAHRNEAGTSWVRIRLACLIELGQIEESSTPFNKRYLADSKRRFRAAKEATQLTAGQILDILDRYDLGPLDI